MIPLYIFLIAWLVFLGLFAVMSSLTVMQMTRFGIIGSGTWIATVVFLTVVFLVILGAGSYFMVVDWEQPVNLFSAISTSQMLNFGN